MAQGAGTDLPPALYRVPVIVAQRSPIPQRLKRRLYPDAAYSWLRRFSPDLTVISQCGNSDGLRWMETCARMRLPFAIVCQAAAEWAWPDDALAERFRAVCGRAAGLYFVSNANLRLTLIQFATEFAGAKVIRNPFQVGYDANPPWPRSDVVSLACVARLEPLYKGQDILFQVLARDKWRSRPLQVTLYGEGDNAANLRRLKDMWGLWSVVFGGTLRPEEIWTKHQALILPSRVEGLPVAVVEAMLCGRPCILSDVAGNAEVVEDGVTGFVAAAPHPEFSTPPWSAPGNGEMSGRRSADPPLCALESCAPRSRILLS